MTTLITGGGSQTGLILAKLLTEANHKVLFASRSGARLPDGFPSVTFDWFDPSTFEAPFIASTDISSVYLLSPPLTWDPIEAFQPFIDIAIQKGVKRFVLLSAAGAESEEEAKPGNFMGSIHAYLHAKGLDYVILRPTWFLENLGRIYSAGIKSHGIIETIVPTGRIPFVSVEDIAQVAFKAIVDPNSLPTREPTIIGPDLLSYTEIAEILSEVLGRKITHTAVTEAELKRRYVELVGIPENFVQNLISHELGVETGITEGLVKRPNASVGKVGVRGWIEKNKDVFASP